MNIEEEKISETNYCKLEKISYEHKAIQSNNEGERYNTLKQNGVRKLDKSTNVNWLSDIFFCDIDIENAYSVTIQEVSISSDPITIENYIALNQPDISDNKNEVYIDNKFVILQDQASSSSDQTCFSNDILSKAIRAAESGDNIISEQIVDSGSNAIVLQQGISCNKKSKAEFKCDSCEKRFYRKEYLVRHEKNHHQTQIFSCESCQKQFRNKTHLKRHQIVHTSEKPYTCEFCLRNFNRKDNLHTHMKKRHTNKQN